MTERLAEKVLLIGWDAADWTMIRPLIDKGQMPHLQKLISRGVTGNLATIQPVLSPMLWNSIATGKRADKHGIHGFVEPNPDGSGIRAVTSTSRKCKAVWNILSQNDLTSNVLCWFASHPAEPIKGCVVTDRYTSQLPTPAAQRRPMPRAFHPRELSEELTDLVIDPRDFDAASLLPFIPNADRIDQDNDPRLAKLATLLGHAASQHAAACWLLRNRPADLSAFYYSAIDQFAHEFMPYHPPQLPGVTDEDFEIYKDVMVGCYRFHDMMLGALLEYAGDDTTVMLISDHGFRNDQTRLSNDATVDPESWHHPFGIACLAGPGIKQQERLYGATLLDVTPTLLTLFGLPVGSDMDGRPWVEVFDRPVAPQRVVSWESFDGDDGMHADELREDPAESAEALKHLVELGYIEAPSEDTQTTIDRTLLDMKSNLAAALADSRRVALSIPLWHELLEARPEARLQYTVQLARCLFRCERVRDGIALLERLPDPLREHVAVQLMLGEAHLSVGNRGQALEYIQEAERLAPDQPGVHVALGAAHVQLDDWDRAQTAFESAREIDPQHAPAWKGLAQVALHGEEPAIAMEHALQAIGLMHHYPDAHYCLGVALSQLGMDAQAIQAFEVCLSINPDHPDAHTWLAKLYRRDTRDEKQAIVHELESRGAEPRRGY